MTRQELLLDRLTAAWAADGSDMTFEEWRTWRSRSGIRGRCLALQQVQVNPQQSALYLQMLAQQQFNKTQNSRRSYGSLLGNALGGVQPFPGQPCVPYEF